VFKEHINSIKKNSRTYSDYIQHILETTHVHAEIENTMDILPITNKEKHMNTRQKFYIYNLGK